MAWRATSHSPCAASRSGVATIAASGHYAAGKLEPGGAIRIYLWSGWLEDDMNRHDRELLNKQMSHLQPAPRRDGMLMLVMASVFIAGLTAGGLPFSGEKRAESGE
jgi:hypothetical protein